MKRKSAAFSDRGIVELGYHLLRFIDDVHNPRPFKVSAGSVVSMVAVTLHLNEMVAKLSDFH